VSTVKVQSKMQEMTTTPQQWLQKSWLEPRLVVITLVALLFGFVAGQFAVPDVIIVISALIAYGAGGFFGAKAAVESLITERKIDVDMLMVLAALGAASIGEWHEGALLLFLFSLSNVLQEYAIGRSRQAIRSLFKLYPEEAKVRRDDTIITLKIDAIKQGDIVLIEPGERIPVDGEIVSGSSTVDQSPITGESMPVNKAVGDTVFAGTLNKQGILDVRATKLATDTTLARIIHMVENAQENQAPTERFLDRFEQYYASFIIASVLLFIIVPPALGLVDFNSNFYRAMVLMTVASPCALVISVPASFISAIASAARGGVLFKGGAFLEELAAVKVVAFDKTGTLTIGEPRLTDIVAQGLSEDDVLAVAAAVENRSEHPLARALVLAAQERNLSIAEVSDFEALSGQGVRASLDERPVMIGSIRFIKQTVPLPDELAQAQLQLENDGKTTMGIVRDGRWLGILAVADQLRSEAATVVQKLQDNNIEVAMFTGDNERVAHNIAVEVGIKQEHVHAGLMPDEKVDALQTMSRQYGAIAMVGDGVNDAPALATANVGIAMGAAGTDVALETADVVLMADRIERLLEAINLSKKARRVVWQNIVFSIAVIILLIAGAFIINLPLPLGVLGHEGSTVIVVLNSLIALLLIPEIQRRHAEKQRAA